MPKSRRARRPSFDHGQPIWRPNLAPLAAVWIIGATMMMGIYVNPPHALTVDLPLPYALEGVGPLTPNVDTVAIERDGTTRWNGVIVDDEELSRILSLARKRTPQAALLLRPDAAASYARSLEVLGIIGRNSLLDRCFRFSGIARFAQYEAPETFDRLLPYQREDCPASDPTPRMPRIVG